MLVRSLVSMGFSCIGILLPLQTSGGLRLFHIYMQAATLSTVFIGELIEHLSRRFPKVAYKESSVAPW